ncbi:MAG: hypothetical protein Hens3KO_00630 [Henriciella sp.]
MNWTYTDIFRVLVIAVTLLIGIAACGPPGEKNAMVKVDIKPQDFALLPCDIPQSEKPCVLVVAGGKRVLFGAPAGVAKGLPKAELGQLDAVMLFSLTAGDIEGLDEIRNASWHAGRTRPLALVGPEGTVAVATALNLAFEQADALRIVEEGIPPGGYDAAVLEAVELPAGRDLVVYDTGDFRVEIVNSRAIYLTYRIDYGATLLLQPCRAEMEVQATESTYTVLCENGAMTWPLKQALFLETTP